MITLRDIAALGADSIIWDSGKGAVAGFGARRQKGATVAYVVKYRTAGGKQRWHTIGKHGSPWTPDLARAEAKRLLGDVAKGLDPAAAKQAERRMETVADLCELYRAETAAGRVLTRRKVAKKPSTLDGDRGRIERHIVPILGDLKIGAVTRKDVERFRDAVTEGKTAAEIKTGKQGLARVTGGKGTATRALGLLGAIFSYAMKEGLRPDNPVTGVDRHAYESRKRRMTPDEYAALAAALDNAPSNMWPPGVSATWFLLLTGWRRGEALGLRWEEVDLPARTARLEDTKTGDSIRPLSKAVCDILDAMPRLGEYVFPASTGDSPMTGYPKIWTRIAAQAALPDDVTPHVFRHSFASLANDLGYSEPVIAAMLGHKRQTMTSKYIHNADAVLLAAADAVAERTMALMRKASVF